MTAVQCVLLISCFLIGLTAAEVTELPCLEEILSGLDVNIPGNDPMKETLHPKYIANLKDSGNKDILLVHDLDGNLHQSTYHYLGLKLHELYEYLTTFLTNNNVRQYSNEIDFPPPNLMYVTHRDLMRHTLGLMSLEFHLSFLYKTKYEVLRRLELHHPRITRRDILRHLSAKDNFEAQFNAMLIRIRNLLSEQMIYSEKAFYWNINLKPEEIEQISTIQKSEITNLMHIHKFQSVMADGLKQYSKILKAKRKFYVYHVLPDELEERKKIAERVGIELDQNSGVQD